MQIKKHQIKKIESRTALDTVKTQIEYVKNDETELLVLDMAPEQAYELCRQLAEKIRRFANTGPIPQKYGLYRDNHGHLWAHTPDEWQCLDENFIVMYTAKAPDSIFLPMTRIDTTRKEQE
ncbi:hypothetical protein [Bifidobacterium oedipodis]|uniref:Uncharacterized protein n=1 Tax=Bifidobacterium oedipodis TaxID=2675322 RepID=A0A7Y0HSS7_9BIFI|nr:hypothetical protein [Bifidobacterium sp. DSM 109957]NMM93918.1 hypothetical protein [Bifidobacterium sp. DSM 109957]